MALIKPISGFPNNNTIDVITGSTFYTVIQGASSIVVGYACTIYNADTFERIWTTDKIELPEPLTSGDTLEVDVPPGVGMENDKSYYWILRMYQKTTDMFVTSSTVQKDSTETSIRIRAQSNVKSGMEIRISGSQRKVTNYDISTGVADIDYPFPYIPETGTRIEIYSDYVDSIGFPFKTRQTPIVKITTSENTGKSRTGVFYGKFDETLVVQIQWYKVIIYDSALNIYHDSGKIFSSAMEYEYTNLGNHQTYYIQFVVQTVDDIFIESEMKEVQVAYSSFDLDTGILASANCDSTISIIWKEDRLSNGIATGNYSFIYMGIETLLGMTADGVALPQRYYSWLDTIDSVDTIWDDNLIWTESLAKTEPSKRLQVSSGYVYYSEANGQPLSIDFNNFTLMTDVFIPAGQTGRIVTIKGTDGSEILLKCENNNLIYSINDVVFSTYPVTTETMKRYKISLTPTKAVIQQTNLQ